jgi:hypothetical protein
MYVCIKSHIIGLERGREEGSSVPVAWQRESQISLPLISSQLRWAGRKEMSLSREEALGCIWGH